MPFTFSHIAAVLPFHRYGRRPWSFSMLAIGSMVPDFEYFLRMTLYGHYGHTFLGIFIFDLPVALICYGLFQAFVRKPLLSHLPAWLYRRMAGGISFNWLQYLRHHAGWWLLSFAVGLATHFVWDAFTHNEEYEVARFVPWLVWELPIWTYSIPVHLLLHLVSSVLGLVILFVFMWRMPVNTRVVAPTRRQVCRFWAWLCLVMVLAITIRCLFGVPADKYWQQLIVIGCSAFLLALLIVGIAYTIHQQYTYET